MNLADHINSEIKEAMKAKNADRLRALRGIKSAFMLLQTSDKASSLSEDDYQKTLAKLAKQRKDSLEVYIQQGREDLAEVEKSELAVIEEFLPEQMSEEEVRNVISKIITEAGLSGPASMGKAMPLAMKELSGKADGKLISAIVKEVLSN